MTATSAKFHNNPLVKIDGTTRRRRLMGSEGKRFVMVKDGSVAVQETEFGYEAVAEDRR